ncbi:MAG: hypothetical protein ACKVOR_14135 [Flavobacteriales bacterium]
METNRENFISMLGKVAYYFNNNGAEITAAIPIFASQKAIFDTKRGGILAMAIATDTDLGGYAIAKNNAQQLVLGNTLSIGQACAGYYTVTVPDPIKKSTVNWNKSELDLMRDSDLYVAGFKTHAVADGIKTLLVPFGFADTDVDTFGTNLANYLGLVDAPLSMVGQRSGLFKEFDKRIDDMRTFLRDTMDTIFAPLQVTESLIYDTYQAVRRIDDAPGGSGAGVIIAFIGANTLKKVNSGTAINDENIGLTITNRSNLTGSQPLTIFFEAAGYVDGAPLDTSPQSLGPGDVLTMLAGELGYAPSKPVLHIRNNDPGLSISFKVEIG